MKCVPSKQQRSLGEPENKTSVKQNTHAQEESFSLQAVRWTREELLFRHQGCRQNTWGSKSSNSEVQALAAEAQ